MSAGRMWLAPSPPPPEIGADVKTLAPRRARLGAFIGSMPQYGGGADLAKGKLWGSSASCKISTIRYGIKAEVAAST